MAIDEKDADRGKVKLIFDVMPQVQPPAPVPPPSLPRELVQPPVKPYVPPQAAPPPTAPPGALPVAPSSKASFFSRLPHVSMPRLKLPYLSWKYSVIVAGLAVVGLGGWFAYGKFFTKNQAPIAAPPATPTHSLPADWLKKYFHSDTCADQTQCGPDADPDKDGLTNVQELKYGTDPLNPDSDFDGLADGDEIHVYNSDPIVADSNGNGFEDGIEVRNGYNPITNSTAHASAVERQSWEQNIQTYGLHEPTKTFLAAREFKTLFVPTTTPQLIIQIPKDWGLDPGMSSQTTKYLKSPDGNVKIGLFSGLGEATTTPADAATSTPPVVPSVADVANKIHLLPGYKNIRSTVRNIRNNAVTFEEYQYTFQQSLPIHGVAVILTKEGNVESATIEVPENHWNENSIAVMMAINSVR